MAYIYDYRDGQEIIATTTVTPELPPHASGDLLLVFAGRDEASATSITISGGSWTIASMGATAGGQQVNYGTGTTNSTRGVWMYVVASSSNEPAPRISHATAQEWAWVTVTVKGAPATNPIDIYGTNNDGTGAPYDATGLTTTVTNTLVFCGAITDGGVSPTAYPPLMNLSNKDSGANSCSVAWTFQKNAAGTGGWQWYMSAAADETCFVYFAVKDGSSGTLLPVYIDSSLLTLITPNKSATCLVGEASTPTNNQSLDIVPLTGTTGRRNPDRVWVFDDSGPSYYTDYTSAAADTTDADVNVSPDPAQAGDIFYIGDDAKFYAISFWRASCSNCVGGAGVWEYYSNTASGWALLPNQYDSTSRFTANIIDTAILGWSNAVASDWITYSVNSESRYWIRYRQTTAFTTATGTISEIWIGDFGILYDAVAFTADVGYNPFEARIGSSPAGIGAHLAGQSQRWSGAKNFSSTATYLVTSYLFASPRDYIDVGLKVNGGVLFITHDQGSPQFNSKAWVVGSLDTPSTLPANYNMVGVQPTNSDQVAWNDSPTLTDIRYQCVAPGNQYGACLVRWGHIVQAGTTQIYGGSSGNPITYTKLVRSAQAFPVPMIDSNVAYQKIKLGGTSGSLYCNMQLFALSFPTSVSDDPTSVNWHVDNQEVGLGFYIDTQSGDTCKVKNAQISSNSWWRFEIQSSASSEATYDFSGLTLVGADVILRDVMTNFTKMTFINPRNIDLQTGVGLINCNLTLNTADCFDFTGAGWTFDESVFDVASITSGSAAIRVADPSIFTDCSFTGGGGHALEITAIGTYSFVGNEFSSFGVDGSNGAALYNNSGGLVTINVSGGGSIPTVRNGDGSSTIINNAVNVTVTVKDEQNNNIQNARVSVQTANTFSMAGAVADDGGSQTNETTAANNATANDMNLLPVTPAVNDAYYFGAPKPFFHLIINIGQNGSGAWTVVWEYWNGSNWNNTIPDIYDRTNGFRAGTGNRDVKFSPPSDWATTTVQDISAFWIRARINSYTSITTQPLGTQAWVYLQIMNALTTPAGVATESFNYPGDTSVIIRVRKSSPGDTKYLPINTTGTITSTGFSLTQILIWDNIA